MKDRVDDFLDKVVLPPQWGIENTVAAPVRIVMGVVCIAVSISKFTRHADLVASFEDYGIPNADRAVTLAGIIELTLRLVGELEAAWAAAPSDEWARWQRDRSLLRIADKACAARRERAWELLGGSSSAPA